MTPRKLSATQTTTLATLRAHGGIIARLPGGFWTYPACPINAAGIPEWWVSVQTVRGLEKIGALARTHRTSEEWRDPRSLTEETPPTTPAPRRRQKVIVEYHGEQEFWVLFDDGAVEIVDTPAKVLRAVSKAAERGNPGVTITSVEWRDVPEGFQERLQKAGLRRRGQKV